MTMKPNGKFTWSGAIVPPGTDDPEEQVNFTVFADDFDSALQAYRETMSHDFKDYDLVMLSRGPDVSEESFEISDEISARLRDVTPTRH